MTQRKFKPETRGGYWVRNVETRETDGPFVLQAEIGNHSLYPPTDNPLHWHLEIFTANGKYKFNSDESPFDLIEETENE